MMMLVRVLLLSLLFTFAFAEDFYGLLGVTKNANQKEIRKAFKEKALKHHPDKNTDDPEAHEKFVRINRAYEVLKDEELRKKYDLHGEEGLDESRSWQQYHSWNYYHDNFGIYDDDPEVITLNKADFEQSVSGSPDIWFINFYHPMCSHCHTLAPVWREVARELEGVRSRYSQEKTKEDLLNYMLQQVRSSAVSLTSTKLRNLLSKEEYSTRPWLIIFFADNDEVDEFWVTQIKLSAILDGLVTVGFVECFRQKDLCTSLDMQTGIKFFASGKIESGDGREVSSLNAQEIAKEVLELLPEMQLLDEATYKVIRQNLESHEDSVSWLIQFSGDSDDDAFEIRKLPALLPSLNLGRIKCSQMKKQCDDLYIAKTPSFMLFKPGGGYELHHGRLLAHDIAVFAREGASAPHFQILTPQEFPKVLSDGSTWFVDFYAPWCPPCMKLLPEFRKASKLMQTPINFGSIDCTLHHELCSKFNIHQYPTTILYNQSVPHEYMGYHTAAQIVEFVEDTLNPAVVVLDEAKFEKLISNKVKGEVWVVDYFATWCGHCREMAPEYRKFARMMEHLPNVHVASIDCAEFGHICKNQGISSYPSIMLYPASSFGNQKILKFNGWSRDAEAFRQWMYSNLPSRVTELDEQIYERVLRSKQPWLIDFYAPWCGHCQVFAPDFEDIAQAMEGSVNAGKLNCEKHRRVCQGAGVRAYPTVRLYRGSPNGDRQSTDGINFRSLLKEDILSNLPHWLPKDKIGHDEL
ncbi:DnaJ subfamily C member 10-like [Homarus americanus]|uniref:DnaJ homolog subfamily C member 10 n=1 Tax=Homarus americanus TaxID=6706 RepID=A0A8J5MZT8_HOMAM|nr:DnaJ subfamily C member 10-like [Homarus americanus]